MSYNYTGQARNTTVNIIRGDEATSHDLRAAFDDPQGQQWPQLTDTEFQRLTAEEFAARLQAFCDTLYAAYPGLQADCPDLASGCIVWNPTMCPLPIAPETVPEEPDQR